MDISTYANTVQYWFINTSMYVNLLQYTYTELHTNLILIPLTLEFLTPFSHGHSKSGLSFTALFFCCVLLYFCFVWILYG